MTIQQLEYILALDTHRHFVTAAEHCFVTQPTITTQVKKLEDEIGLLIFDRTKHPLEPTTAGIKIIDKARVILNEMNHLKEMVSSEVESIKGAYTIGIIPTIAPFLVPLFAKEFSKDNPDTFLTIKEMKSEQIITALKKGTIDIGILATPLEENAIREIPMYYEPFLFFSNADHPLQNEKKISSIDLSKKDELWLLNEGNCFRNQVLNICNSKENEDNRNVKFESGSILSLIEMVKLNNGYTILPELATNGLEKQIKRFEEPEPTREVSLAVSTTFCKEALLELIRKQILVNIPEQYKKNERYIRVKWR